MFANVNKSKTFLLAKFVSSVLLAPGALIRPCASGVRVPLSAMFLDLTKSDLQSIESALDANAEYRACTKDVNLLFSLAQSNDTSECLTVDIVNGGTRVHSYDSSSTDISFVLVARSDQWSEFFQPLPKPPFQSVWGMLRTFGEEHGVSISGDAAEFARYARVWRLALDILRTTVQPPVKQSVPSFSEERNAPEEEHPESTTELTGTYLPTTTSLFGHSRVFLERAGSGPQKLLFLHTAGADSRQFHALMRRRDTQSKYTMVAFDLPGHGRSDLGSNQVIGDLTLDEENYVDVICQVVRGLGWEGKGVIVAGASMAGQICLALAIRAGVDIDGSAKNEDRSGSPSAITKGGLDLAPHTLKGVIACEACAHIPTYPPIYAVSDTADEAILNPETVCGMMSPTAPAQRKREVWWGYSSQGVGVFKGDLRFYFQGWDGRARLKTRGVGVPVMMLTGEFDYSCTPEMSRETRGMVREDRKEMVRFEVVLGLGHFSFSEDPERFVGWLDEGVRWIEERAGGRRGGEI